MCRLHQGVVEGQQGGLRFSTHLLLLSSYNHFSKEPGKVTQRLLSLQPLLSFRVRRLDERGLCIVARSPGPDRFNVPNYCRFSLHVYNVRTSYTVGSPVDTTKTKYSPQAWVPCTLYMIVPGLSKSPSMPCLGQRPNPGLTSKGMTRK